VGYSSDCKANRSKYWNWGKYADPTTSPIFNGDAHSMGGNGQSIKHGGYALGMASTMVPAGDGGGCVLTGPFAKLDKLSIIKLLTN
jgi:tyrosinase